MINPQKEDGYIEIANEIAGALMKTHLSGYENRVLWAIFRKTYGWHKKEDWITNSQIAIMTNIAETHISRTIKMLVQRKIVIKNGKKLSFQKKYDRWKKFLKLTNAKKVTKKLTSIQILVEHYKKIKKYDTIPNWDKEHFARATASAKRILSQADDETQSCKAITEIGSYHDNAGLSWTIETIVKKFPDWKLGKLGPKERKPQQSKQDKNLEGFADFAKEKDAKKIV